MRKLLVICALLSSICLLADEPKLLILTTANQEVEIPIASVQKITYDAKGTTMYVSTTSGEQTYAVVDITKMTLANVPESTSIPQITSSPTPRFTKVVKDGVVYVVKDGKLFTMKGEQQ